VIAFQDPLGQLPEAASTFAPDVDGLFYFCTWVSLFFFALILVLILFSAIKWRRRTADQPAASNVTHNTNLEIVWTAIPTVILMVIFAWGWKGNLDQSVAPGDSLQYRATAFQWGWNFYHPGDTQPSEDIYVPLGKPIKFTIDSLDVLHAFFVPAFRCKRDVVPGRYQVVWFRPTMLGTFPIFCAEYCGNGHSKMTRQVHVVTQDKFDTRPWAKLSDVPEERGAMYYRMNCLACHSLDGKAGTGPTFQDLWDRKSAMSDGTEIVVDEAYVRESIRMPNAKKVKGFESAAMTQFTEAMLSDDAVSDLIAFLKTVKSK
jgi:cytochrome c oxidase subunit 2